MKIRREKSYQMYKISETSSEKTIKRGKYGN